MGVTVEFCGEIKRETDKAFMVFDGQNEIWMPKSMIQSKRQIGYNRSDFVFEIPEWLAKEKGIV